MSVHAEYVERIPKAQATHCSEREKQALARQGAVNQPHQIGRWG